MRDAKTGVLEAVVQFRMMLCKSKVLVSMLALALLLISYLQPLADVAAEVNERINLVEPFLLLINSGDSFPSTFFYTYIFFVVLLSDLPMFEHGFRYRLIRMTKRSWYVGQIILVFVLTLAFAAFIYIVSILPFIGRLELSPEWSRCIVSLTKTSMASDKGISLILDRNIIKVYTPMEAVGYSTLYFMVYLFTSAMFVVVVHAKWKSIRPAGICGLLAIYLFDYIRIFYLPFKYVRYSITAMSRLATIDNGYSQYAPTMKYVNSVWSILVILLLTALWYVAKRLEVDGEIAEEG